MPWTPSWPVPAGGWNQILEKGNPVEKDFHFYLCLSETDFHFYLCLSETDFHFYLCLNETEGWGISVKNKFFTAICA